MKIVHLIQYHLGGGRKGKGGKGGQTPAPQLPNAGKPYVDSVSYDKDTKKVRLRAQNARAGEVKTPLGDWQEFPVDVPEPTPLPDAGKPFVEGVTYDPDTKKVKVRAKVAQAGEVKTPEGDLQEFPIHVPTPPAPPAPTLPDAGKPRVSKFDYDPATRKVTVQASVSQAGEVKTPLGDEQTFDIPAEAAKPEVKGLVFLYEVQNGYSDRGVEVIAGFAESVTIDGQTWPCRAYVRNGSAEMPAEPVMLFSDIFRFDAPMMPLPSFQSTPGRPEVISQYPPRLTAEGILLVEQQVMIQPY